MTSHALHNIMPTAACLSSVPGLGHGCGATALSTTMRVVKNVEERLVEAAYSTLLSQAMVQTKRAAWHCLASLETSRVWARM